MRRCEYAADVGSRRRHGLLRGSIEGNKEGSGQPHHGFEKEDEEAEEADDDDEDDEDDGEDDEEADEADEG